MSQSTVNEHPVRGRVIFCVMLLLAGVGVFLYSVTNANDASLIPSGAAVLVIGSALGAVSAILEASRGMEDKGKRRVRNWSVWYLALALALLVISGGFGAILSTPTCQRYSDACSFGYGFQLLWVWAALGIASVITYLGAVIVGLSSAAKSGQRGWFVGLLAYLIASVLILVAAVVLAQAITNAILAVGLAILLLVPPFLPVATLIYSFSGRQPRIAV